MYLILEILIDIYPVITAFCMYVAVVRDYM